MSDFNIALEAMRRALKNAPGFILDHHEPFTSSVPESPKADSAIDLLMRFTKELNALGATVIEVSSPSDLVSTVSRLVKELQLRSVALAENLRIDLGPIMQALEQRGTEIFKVAEITEDQRLAYRRKLSECDASIIEADCAVALSGTLVFVSTPNRPRSLSLVPPTNIVLLQADRILPSLAAVPQVLGENFIRDNPVAYVTGPSRTADIEKRIVRGAHGPKALYVVILNFKGDGTNL